MNKIKKIFKFLPVMFLSVLCCITSVLCYDQEVDTTYASDYLLESNTSISSFSYYGSDNTYQCVLSLRNDIYVYQDFTNGGYFVICNFDIEDFQIGNYHTGAFSSYADRRTHGSLMYRFGNFDTMPNDPNIIVTCRAIAMGYELNTNSDGYRYKCGLDLVYNDGLNTSRINQPFYAELWNDFNISWYNSNATNINLNTTFYSYSFIYDFVDDFALGMAEGYTSGYDDGYARGVNDGYNNGYRAGFQAGALSREPDVTYNYNLGYQNGYNEAFNSNMTAVTIFNGILQVGMLPINVLLAIFNFEILGINLSAFVSAILTVCLTVIVIRTIKGGGND